MALTRATLVPLFLRRHRSILLACAVTLVTCATLTGVILFSRWQHRRALDSDAQAVLVRTAQQLTAALQGGRTTLVLLADALQRQPSPTPAQQQALGISLAAHTRHLLGVGLLAPRSLPTWWTSPRGLSARERTRLHDALLIRTRTRGLWRNPATWVVLAGARRLLVTTVPLRTAAREARALLGVWPLTPLLEEAFAASLPPSTPAQLTDGDAVLFRTPTWRDADGTSSVAVLRQAVNLDGQRWLLAMQPARTRVAQTLSGTERLLVSLGVLAAAGITLLVWMLAARTWWLRRAVERRTAALRRATQRLRQLATTDELTGLHNRRFFLHRWGWEVERAKRYRRPLACLMVDVNHFKQVNDRLGHHAGDTLLQRVAQELRTMLRQSDILARFGGDEFVIALPETTDAQAVAVAEKLRQIRVAIPESRARGIPEVSLSVGVGRVDERNGDAQEILNAADASLYADKQRRPSSS